MNRQEPESSLSRKFGANYCMLRYKIINTYFLYDTFWVTKISKIIRGFTCMQLFVYEKGFVKVYGMRFKKYFLQIKLSYSAKKSESQKNLLSTLIELKWGMKL